jgi:hypothetical protein
MESGSGDQSVRDSSHPNLPGTCHNVRVARRVVTLRLWSCSGDLVESTRPHSAQVHITGTRCSMCVPELSTGSFQLHLTPVNQWIPAKLMKTCSIWLTRALLLPRSGMTTFLANNFSFLTPPHWRNDLKKLRSRREALWTLLATPLSTTRWSRRAAASLVPRPNVLHPSLRRLIELQGPAVVVTELSSLVKFQLGPDAWTASPSLTATDGWNTLWVQPEGDALCLHCAGSFFTGVLQDQGAVNEKSCGLYGLSPQQVIRHADACLNQARRAGLFVPATQNPSLIDEDLLQLVSRIRDSGLGDPDPDLCGLNVIFTQAGDFDAVIRHYGGRYHLSISPSLDHVSDDADRRCAAECHRPLLKLEGRLHPLTCRRDSIDSVNQLSLNCEVNSKAQAVSVLSTVSQCPWRSCSTTWQAKPVPTIPEGPRPRCVTNRNRTSGPQTSQSHKTFFIRELFRPDVV